MVQTTLIFILFVLVGLQVHASSYLKSYADFVHLPQQQQDKIIIQTMELVAELESKYEKETAVFGYSPIREEQFKKTVQKVISFFFIDSAYAQTTSYPWKKMGEDFSKLISNGTSNKCLYAGWVSETKIVAGKTVCSHPSFIPKSKVNGYQRPAPGSKCLTSDGKEDPKKIQCSPLIFGYKNQKKESLFCVDAKNGSHNSSFDCMQAALSNPPGPDADTKEDRIKFLREKIHANPNIFKNAQEFIYKACICSNLPKDASLNKKYHQYMQPHRTCYGLMEMMGETFLSCQNTDIQIDLSIFKSLKEHTSKLKSGGNDIETDKYYKTFIDKILKSSSAEVDRLCHGSPTQEERTEPTPNDPGTDPNTKPEPEKVIELQEVTVTAKRPEPKLPKVKLLEVSDRFKLPEINPTLIVVPQKPKKELICQEALCKKILKDKKEDFECSFEIVDKATKQPVAISDEPKNLPTKSDDKTILISGKAEDQDFKDLTCNIKWEKDGPSLEVTIKEKTDTTVTVEAVAKDPGKSTLEFVFEDKPSDLKDVPPSEKTDADQKDPAASSSDLVKETIQPRAETPYKVCGVLKDETLKEIKKVCVDIEPLKTGDGEPDLTVKIIDPKATAFIIEAKVENQGDNVFSWSIKNPPQGLVIPKGWETKEKKSEPKKKKTPENKGRAADSSGEATESPDKKKEEVKPVVLSDNKIITQPRLTMRYEVCGTLKTKEGKEIKTSCVSVEPLASKGNSNQYPNQGPPPTQTRPSSDISGHGVK